VHLKKLRRAEGGAKFFGVFRVKNHNFTPKNHIFFNCRGRRENFWGFSSFRGGRVLDPPLYSDLYEQNYFLEKVDKKRI
jgi:hypothetical protein